MFWQLLILQVGFFVLLLFVMQKLFHGHLIRGIKSVEKLQQQNIRREEEVNKSQEAVIRDCQERIRKTDAEIREKRAVLEEELKALRVKAMERMETEKALLSAELDERKKSLERKFESDARKKAKDIAIGLVRESFGEKMMQALHEKLTEELLEGLDASVGAGSHKEIRVMTAFALTEKQKEILLKKVGAHGVRPQSGEGGHRPPLHEQIDPGLVAGFVIVMDELVLDGSLKNRFERNLT